MLESGNFALPGSLMVQRILHKCTSCVVINKLKGEATEGAGQGMISLPDELAKILPAGTECIEAVNRLDVPVTGCAVFALTKNALAFLNAAFASNGSVSIVEKNYWAIVEKPSFVLPERGELTHWIQTDSRFNKSIAYNEEIQGRKKATLLYKVTGEGKNYLFMEVKLLSGRHHQIRAQFAAAGLHIKGDLKYGAKRSEKGGGIRLHARSVSFPDPANTAAKIHVTADPPEMDNLWEAFPNPARQE